ncbi:MAG TPA: hypothetical protein VGC64_10105 [Pyrinomonadaceae bacterium]
MKSRVIACRQRLRRTRAAQQSGGRQASLQPSRTSRLPASAAESPSCVLKSGGFLPDIKAAGRPVERHR